MLQTEKLYSKTNSSDKNWNFEETQLSIHTSQDRQGVGAKTYFTAITSMTHAEFYETVQELQSAAGYDTRGYGISGITSQEIKLGLTIFQWSCYASCD